MIKSIRTVYEMFPNLARTKKLYLAKSLQLGRLPLQSELLRCDVMLKAEDLVLRERERLAGATH